MTPELQGEFHRMVLKHNQDLYEGQLNGKPALCIRMALAEKEIEMIQKAAEEIKKDSKAIKALVIGVVLTLVGEIIVKLVVH